MVARAFYEVRTELAEATTKRMSFSHKAQLVAACDLLDIFSETEKREARGTLPNANAPRTRALTRSACRRS